MNTTATLEYLNQFSITSILKLFLLIKACFMNFIQLIKSQDNKVFLKLDNLRVYHSKIVKQ